MKITHQKWRPNRPEAISISMLGYTLLLAWTRIGKLHRIPALKVLKGNKWQDFLTP